MGVVRVLREIPDGRSEVIQIVLDTTNLRPSTEKIQGVMLLTLLRPDGPTDVQIRSASVSRGSEPTVCVNVNREVGNGTMEIIHTKRRIIVPTDITLSTENIFLEASSIN